MKLLRLAVPLLVLIVALGPGSSVTAQTATPPEAPAPQTPAPWPPAESFAPQPAPTPALTPTPTPEPPPGVVDGMILIPSGRFKMGSETGRDDEKPVHVVYPDAFWIDWTEVTVEAYAECVAAGRCSTTSAGTQCNYGNPVRTTHPINCVNWFDAKAYCEWAGKRLPTEAEWEMAARGTDGLTYPWGDKPASCRITVMSKRGTGCGENSTWPVGSMPDDASPYGVLDMAGNVREWVADRYDASYYARSPVRNPRGPDTGDRRVLRGGSWIYGSPWLLESPRRFSFAPDVRTFDHGFRCACDVGRRPASDSADGAAGSLNQGSPPGPPATPAR